MCDPAPELTSDSYHPLRLQLYMVCMMFSCVASIRSGYNEGPSLFCHVCSLLSLKIQFLGTPQAGSSSSTKECVSLSFHNVSCPDRILRPCKNLGRLWNAYIRIAGRFYKLQLTCVELRNHPYGSIN